MGQKVDRLEVALDQLSQMTATEGSNARDDIDTIGIAPGEATVPQWHWLLTRLVRCRNLPDLRGFTASLPWSSPVLSSDERGRRSCMSMNDRRHARYPLAAAVKLERMALPRPPR